MDEARKILLLESDAQNAQEILNFLKDSSEVFSVSHFQDISGGIRYLENTLPDVVLLDSKLAENPEFKQFRYWLNQDNIPCILLSSVNGTEVIGLAEKFGAQEYLI